MKRNRASTSLVVRDAASPRVYAFAIVSPRRYEVGWCTASQIPRHSSAAAAATASLRFFSTLKRYASAARRSKAGASTLLMRQAVYETVHYLRPRFHKTRSRPPSSAIVRTPPAFMMFRA